MTRSSARLPELRTRARYLASSGTLRRVLWWCVGGLIGLGVVWLVVTGFVARQQAQQIAERLQQAKTLVANGELQRAREVAADVPAMASRADRLTSGPAWWIAAHIPYLGQPFDVVRGMTEVTDEAGGAGLRDLLEVARLLDPHTLRLAGDRLDLQAIQAARPGLERASAQLGGAVARFDALPSGSWLGFVDAARAELAGQLHQVNGYVAAAARAARVLPAMLGADGPRTYFVGLQNEAELRGTGGLPGAFAIVTADGGTIHFDHFGSDGELMPAASANRIDTGLDLGAGFAAAYGYAGPTSYIVNSNMSPNFPYAARIWAAMWEKVSGQHVDGAVALDPTVLSYLLSVTGPVDAPNGAQLNADNVVSLTERDQYVLFADLTTRRQFVVEVLRAAADRLTSGSGNPGQLARAVSIAASEQRFLVWSGDPAVQRQLEQTSYAGVIPEDGRPLAAAVLNNVAAGKLDFYLTRALEYRRSGCGPQRDVVATLTLTNHAPASGLPEYVTLRLDASQPAGVQPGDNRTMLDYYATAGAQLLSATVNGKPATVAVLADRGHPIFRVDVELPRGQTQTVVLHLQEPAGDGDPLIWKQPGVAPLTVQANNQRCD